MMTDAPPHDSAAEAAVLAACLQTAGTRELVRRALSGDDFWRPVSQHVWAAMLDLADNGTEPDPITVMNELRRRGQLNDTASNELMRAVTAPVLPQNAAHYAGQVKFCSRQRQGIAIADRIRQRSTEADDGDDLLDGLAAESLALSLLVESPSDDEALTGLSTWDAFLAINRERRWLVPGLISSQDVVMTLSPPGSGKSNLSRQFAMCLANGVHPFTLAQIEPVPTLLIDLENADEELRDESRRMKIAVSNVAGGWSSDRAHIWHHVAGLDIRKAADAQLLERAVADTGAKFVALGSLYNAFRRGKSDWDVAAEECRDVFNRIRAKYGVAWMIEHHMPRGQHGQLSGTPFGSTVFERWPSHGRMLSRIGKSNFFELQPTFRGDRGPRDFPPGLMRGGRLPWTAVADAEELDMIKRSEGVAA